MVRCEFEFSRTNATYFSGEVITGRVILTSSSTRKFDEIIIRLKGQSKIKWDDGENMVHGKETHIDVHEILHEKGNLLPDTYAWVFALPTTENCPSSFAHKFGKIVYTIQLVLHRKYWLNKTFKHIVYIIKPLMNLRGQPDLMRPIYAYKVRSNCCWLFSSSGISTTFGTPFGGYAPGQKLPYFIEIQYKPSANFTTATVKLQKVLRFRATSPQNLNITLQETLSEFSHVCVFEESSVYIHGELDIPMELAVIATQLINLDYALKLTLSGVPCISNTRIWLPIKIGNRS